MNLKVTQELAKIQDEFAQASKGQKINPNLKKLNNILRRTASTLKSEFQLEHTTEVARTIYGHMIEQVNLKNTEDIVAKFKFDAFKDR